MTTNQTIIRKKLILIRTAGIFWIAMGAVLVTRGILFMPSLKTSGFALTLLAALVLGIAKGKYVIKKAGQRNIKRIVAKQAPIYPFHIFPTLLYILIPVMIATGIGIRYLFGRSSYITGGIYCGIGAALLASSLVYFSFKMPQEN